jgi:hypothetical protein
LKKIIIGAAMAVSVLSVGGTAFAGENTGGPHPKPTPIDNFGHAQSICAFSGQNDNPNGFDPELGAIDPLQVGKVQNWGHTRQNAKAIMTAAEYAAFLAGNAPGQTCNGHTGIVASIFGSGKP